MLRSTIPLSRGLLSWKDFVSLFQAMEGPALQTMVENLQTLVPSASSCSGVCAPSWSGTYKGNHKRVGAPGKLWTRVPT